MTETRRHRRPPARLVFWSSVLLFAALFALVTYRYEAEGTVGQKAAQPVQVHKVIKRRVVTTIVGGSGGSTVSSAPAASSSSVSAEPEPEPEPEPVVTSSS
ncbi:MAG TPA: hypothetical protein VFY75_01925 [Solirubrobacterales bacterium]|nr:hypothetical protein [Solirubrobacterales bacterium]